LNSSPTNSDARSSPRRFAQIHVECDEASSDALTGRLMLLGADGIEQQDSSTTVKGGALGVTLVATFEDEEIAAEALDVLRELAIPARLEWLVGDDWADAWKEHWRPMRLGDQLVIVPSWIAFDPAPGDRVLSLDPGRAFGTGQHASTALAAAALERHLAAHPAPLVLDVGCGSGILAFAALLLGAGRAVLRDVDEESVQVASDNAARLGLSDRIDLRRGSTEDLSEPAPLVLANIEPSVLIPMADSLARLVAPGGRLVLSGILQTQRDAVIDAYLPRGLVLDRCDASGDWVAPELVRPAP
jgi:ribosomal protein L11 methyltransferase